MFSLKKFNLYIKKIELSYDSESVEKLNKSLPEKSESAEMFLKQYIR